MTKISEINGVIPALITPFSKNESVNENGLKSLVEHLINKGVNGLYLTGSTGEGFLMTPDERKRVVEVVAEQSQGRVPLIAHVGAIGTKISIDLARHAEAIGCDAISSVPPFYWKFGQESIFKYYKEITESVKIPMIVYNIPLAGLMGIDQIKAFATIDNVLGVKFTATSHHDILRLKDEIGQDFMVYSGCDEMSFSGMGFGADGLIGSFYNLIPEVFLRIYEATTNGNYQKAIDEQKIANAIIVPCTSGNYVGVMKRALTWMGIDGGYSRSPFINISEEEEEKYKSIFRDIKAKYNISNIDLLESL